MWGDEFEALYEQYEREKKFRRTVPAQELWFAILSSQVETGTPYMLFKVPTTLTLDTIVVVEVEVEIINHHHYYYYTPTGCLQSQVEPAEPGHHQVFEPVHGDRAVHLGGRGGRVQPGFREPLRLRGRVRQELRLRQATAGSSHRSCIPYVCRGHSHNSSCVIDCWMQVTKVVTKNLNKVIDINFYPVLEAKNSNFRHRPIGYGPPESPTPTTMIYVM